MSANVSSNVCVNYLTFYLEKLTEILNEKKTFETETPPSTGVVCGKCNERIIVNPRQTRSADEGMTVFKVCKCGTKRFY